MLDSTILASFLMSVPCLFLYYDLRKAGALSGLTRRSSLLQLVDTMAQLARVAPYSSLKLVVFSRVGVVGENTLEM